MNASDRFQSSNRRLRSPSALGQFLLREVVHLSQRDYFPCDGELFLEFVVLVSKVVIRQLVPKEVFVLNGLHL